MKSTIFLKPLEYSILADGEKWRQGDKIKGMLKIKNHSTDTINISLVKMTLALGHFKKIKTKDKKAWDSLSEITMGQTIILPASGEQDFPFEFVLPEDCQITEKDKSLFLTFKSGDELWPLGQLELVIEPKLVMLSFLDIFQNFLRFKVVQTKYSKGMVEFKLNPPNSKELSHVESLLLRMKEVDKTLELEYIFSMHVFELVAGNMMAQKKQVQLNRSLTSKQYSFYGDSLNQDFIIASISEVIKEATPKFNLN